MRLDEVVGSPRTEAEHRATRRHRILLVGSGFRFLSGLSIYTCRMANALADTHDVSVVTLNRLIPRWLYPGRRRVGNDLTSIRYGDQVRIVGHVDWYWGPSFFAVVRTIRREPPDVIVLQWWTASTLHTYLRLARVAAQAGIPMVIEIHETQDTGEARIPIMAAYCRRYFRRLIGRAAGVILHNQHDRVALEKVFGPGVLAGVQVEFAPHGPFDHLTLGGSAANAPPIPEVAASPEDHGARVRLLFFGVIRQYKGLEDLVYALDSMTDEEADRFDIDIVGETWENWTVPAEAITESRHRDRIRFVNRYVTDAEASEFFASADVLVLPYRRGSASGPLHVAMNNGIHVVLYAVGGLVEAASDYAGTTLVPPNDVDALREALLAVGERHRQRFEDPHSWDPVKAAVERILEASAR